MLQLTAPNHFLAPGDRMSVLRLDCGAVACRCHISIIPLSDKIHTNKLSLNEGAGIPAFFFTSASALPASQCQSTPRRSPYRIGIFLGHPTTFNEDHRIALWTTICACHHLATHVVKFSQATAPMAGEQAYLPPEAPKRSDVRQMHIP